MIIIKSDKKLTIESRPIIEINRNLKFIGIANIVVPYKIVCDLTNIPEKEHNIIIQTFLSML